MENIGYKRQGKIGNDIIFKCKNIINFSDFTMVNNKHIKEIQGFVDYINKNNVEGAIVECGVWKGGMMMACINTQQNYNEEREFYLYDTYEGMTEPNSSKDLKQDKENYNRKKEWYKVDSNLVKNNIQLCNYNSEKIHYIKGDVVETLNDIIPEKISILRLDTDWYESTKKELDVLYNRVSNNGFVVIDDYNNKDKQGNPRGARVACNEFFPMISNEMNIMKPLSNEDNIPFSFQKIIRKQTITCFSYSNNNKARLENSEDESDVSSMFSEDFDDDDSNDIAKDEDKDDRREETALEEEDNSHTYGLDDMFHGDSEDEGDAVLDAEDGNDDDNES